MSMLVIGWASPASSGQMPRTERRLLLAADSAEARASALSLCGGSVSMSATRNPLGARAARASASVVPTKPPPAMITSYWVLSGMATYPAAHPSPQEKRGKLLAISNRLRSASPPKLVKGATHEPRSRPASRHPRHRNARGESISRREPAGRLVAAYRTVNGRTAHSLHGYFLRPGDPAVPILYNVDRIRDGGSFSTRRVVAIQHEQAIFSMAASFHKHEEGLSHQVKMPEVPPPESLPSEAELKELLLDRAPPQVRTYWERERPIEIRPVDLSRYLSPEKRAATQQVWIRATGSLGDDLALNQCVLAYASDFTLLDTALIAHGRFIFDPSLMLASLDHSIWFHRRFRADDWLLYAQDSPISGGGRAFCRGALFTRSGELVASTTQEGLVRERRADLSV